MGSMFATSIKVIGILFILNGLVISRPSIDIGGSLFDTCYTFKCPKGTTLCGKQSETMTEDRTKLSVQIKCYDGEGNILKSMNFVEDSPYDKSVYYKKTKFSAVIRRHSYSEDEDFDGGKSYDIFSKPTSKANPKSEVEDLNS